MSMSKSAAVIDPSLNSIWY